ncbi:MAG: glycosyltransferase family 4 protein [Eubacteriales bacterium]|nr:glycosyltransferase family 4 protein [Eubacteriales bacterium]
MKKVLLLVNHDIVVYNFRLEIIERLLHDGYQVFVSSPYGERIEDLKALGCAYIETKVSRHGLNPLEDYQLLTFYRKLIGRIQPDAVLGYTIKPNIYGGIACNRTATPFIANITGLGTAVENSGFIQALTLTLYRFAFRHVQRVFFQNDASRKLFADQNIAPGKHGMLPGSGVNLQRFGLLPYPDDGNGVEFSFISRIMKEKGIDQYIEAAQFIKRKYPDTTFNVCGFCEEVYEERLKRLTDEGVLQYYGLVRDVKEVLAHTHCTVHPTYYPEGISNVLLESCACGRPIITTDRSGCREVIDDGVNGYLCRQQDSQSLIEQLEKFLALSQAERRAMGLNGRAKVEKEFDRQIVVERYMEEIEKAERRETV